jgi:hypothetical protein
MNKVIKFEKLENLLRANWSKFLDRKLLFSFIQEHLQYVGLSTSCQVQSISFSRFEPQEKGFLVWIEFSIIDHSHRKVKGTCEATLHLSGTIDFVRIEKF